MGTSRFVITNHQWLKRAALPGAPGGIFPRGVGKRNATWRRFCDWARADVLGNPMRFVLLPGNRDDPIGVEPLTRGLKFDALSAENLRRKLGHRGEERARRVDLHSRHPQRKEVLEIGEVMYGWRHLAENFFCDLKGLRRITIARTRPAPASGACRNKSNSPPPQTHSLARVLPREGR